MKHIVLLSVLLLSACGGAARNAPVQMSATQSQMAAKVHTELAGMYYERSQMGVALGEIDLALQADSSYAPAYGMRGLVYMALRDDKAADEDFQRSLRLDARSSETHNNYGWFLCQRGRARESIAHFMAALKNPLYETPERAYLNAGICSQNAGFAKDAEEFWQRAIQVKPGFAQALWLLSDLSFNKGDYFAAKKYFAEFAEKGDGLTAENLWLAIRIERKLGDKNAVASYGLRLTKQFPDAPETKLFLKGE